MGTLHIQLSTTVSRLVVTKLCLKGFTSLQTASRAAVSLKQVPLWLWRRGRQRLAAHAYQHTWQALHQSQGAITARHE